MIRKVYESTVQSKETTLLVAAKCEARVQLRAAKYHTDYHKDSKNCNGKEEKVYTSRVYRVVNLGCDYVKVVAAEGDRVNGHDKYLSLEAGKSVTLQNYKNTWYVVA